MRTELHALAQARGVPGNGGATQSRCLMCGDSPWPEAGSPHRVLGSGFSDFQWLCDLGANAVCTGCQGLLSGRPGDVPPPLRMHSIILRDGAIEAVRPRDLWPLLLEPPQSPFVVSWACSGKIHHWLRARWSTPELLMIGHDRETIEYSPHEDRALLDAVHALLYSPTGTGPLLSRRAIAEGSYHPRSVEKFGAARLRDLERVVARYRPSLLLDLVCAAAPLSTTRHEEEDDVIDDDDAEAAQVLSLIAEASAFRAQNGMTFWGGYFTHRIRRFARMPLASMVSRLMEACEVAPASACVAELIEKVGAMSADQVARVETSIRERTDMIVALAFQGVRDRRAKRKEPRT